MLYLTFAIVATVWAAVVNGAYAADGTDASPPCSAAASIGVAHMSRKGVMTLRIRSLPPGPIGEGELRYAPGDPHYREIRQHLGRILPGQSKPVRPWC